MTLAALPGANAAIYCRSLNYGGFTDWYLPSQDELNYLFTIRASLPAFTAGIYWSSTDRAFQSAWWQHMSSGNQSYGYHDGWADYINNPKTAASYVRCVRKF